MATYYDALGVPNDAPREEIERALERTQARLRQMGQWEQQRDLFRRIEETLLDGDNRRAYDMQAVAKGALGPSSTGSMPAAGRAEARGVGRPKAQEKPSSKKGVRRGLLRAAVAVLALALVYGAWVLLSRMSARVDPGIYLTDPGTGQVVAVILERDPAHLFPGNAEPSPAVLVYLISQKKAAWVGEALIDIQFKEGDPAPAELLAEGRKAAERQDLHQSLR